MKTLATLSTAALLAASSVAFGQSSGDKSMDMRGMNMRQCSEMMKGMTMKQCQEMMKGMGMGTDQLSHDSQGATKPAASHQTTAVVKAVDPLKGMVTLAHEPVASLNWPAMTMDFTVQEKTLFDKLMVGKKVTVEFKQQGKDYVVTSVR